MSYALEVKQISYKIAGNQILEDVAFAVEEGNYVSIVGPNGAGKTSLVKIILGLNANYTGEVKIFGQNPEALQPKNIGYVPQLKTSDRNFPATVRELVANGLRGEWAWKITKSEAETVEKILCDTGLEDFCDTQISALSGGELQRTFLARAFARRPKILILDEPATGIDMKAIDDIEEIIAKFRLENHTTVLTITHDRNTAFNLSDKVLMLNHRVYAYDVPAKAFTDEIIRGVFGNIGHIGEMEHRNA
ncbi:MAG: metal ABC transporter ATP-binding protein [Candidatus Kapabacteria bacterium]|nr:metal ABC transporter ATP-binding protein [Candidatus Kapabacteria bacterium]